MKHMKTRFTMFLAIILLLSCIMGGCTDGKNINTMDATSEQSSSISSPLSSSSVPASSVSEQPDSTSNSVESGGTTSALSTTSVAANKTSTEPEIYTQEPRPAAHTSAALNLRKGPGTDYETILTLDYLTYVTEIGYTPSIPDWVYIRVNDSTRDYDGKEGWVATEYLIFEKTHDGGGMAKPVIYLYPTHKMDVQVSVNFADGEFTCTYPDYGDGWNVTAWPDGHLINKADDREYSYLYWEGEGAADYDMSRGFVVKGSDTSAFLQEKLEYIGLTPKEYNEFIVYWLPHMQSNPYNLITFQDKPYTDNVQLEVFPEPDSLLRVFMAYQPLSEPVDIPEQILVPFERKGFAVIEWGGTQVGSGFQRFQH